MTDLRVITGGRSLAPGEPDRIEAAAVSATYDADLLRDVRRAERDARMVVRLMAPAIATTSKTDADLAAMIVAADIREATATAMAFGDAAAAARTLSDVLQAAEAKLIDAMVAIVGEEMAKPPIT
jgi:hypothetical protein